MLDLDHVVVAANQLADGVAWCEATLGITPGPGGEHAFMGTHNRLFSISSPRFERAYFEIIAINPDAPPPGRARWFGLDHPALQAALRRGPRLIHWVARCDDIHAVGLEMRGLGIDGGQVLPAERATPRGVLRWQIGVRDDGRRLFDGALPTLIQWGDVHPADAMPASGVSLQQAALAGLSAAVARMMPASVQTGPTAAAAPIRLTLNTPRGPVVLSSLRIKA